MPKVVFRADASYVIGSGHVVRCAALAHQLLGLGWDVTFLCRSDLPGNFNRWTEAQGFRLIPLPGASGNQIHGGYSDWFGVPVQREIEQVRTAIDGIGGADWLVVDHYASNWEWERALKAVVGKTLVIDDLADRQHDCNVLLDQNYCKNLESRYHNLVPVGCVCLLGPHYALLRPEFAALAELTRSFVMPPRRVLTFFGGADTNSLTGMAVEALRMLKQDIPALEADIVMGAANRHQPDLIERYSGIEWLRLHTQVTNMAELMHKADFSIGAGGGTLWERCLLGLPSVVVVASDNQRESCEALASAGAIHLVGAAANCTATAIADATRGLLHKPGLLAAMSQAARGLMSGWGPHKVRDALVSMTEPGLQ